MNHVIIDAADAVELIEILEYFIETVDRAAAADDNNTALFADCGTYDISDLRTDLTRLVGELKRSPLTS